MAGKLDKIIGRQSNRKAWIDGTHRTVSPTETVERVLRIAPVLGITRVANVTGLDHIGIPVVMVTRPNSRSISVSQGKGLTLDAAKASGLMESVESYSAEGISLPLKLGSYEELRYSHGSLTVEDLGRCASSFFEPHSRMLWVEGVDLHSFEPMLVPYELVHLDLTLQSRPGSGEFPISSNGLASGNSTAEALSHALCELVERDANARWQELPERSRDETVVDLSSFHDANTEELLRLFSAAKMKVIVWDLTSSFGIPSFRCVIVDSEDDPLRPLFAGAGMGSHPTRNIALARAMTEAAQSRLTMIAGSRDDARRAYYHQFRNRDVLQRTRTLIGSATPTRRAEDIPNFQSEDIADDLAFELTCLGGIGPIVVLDLTHPALGIPVMRVVAPQLRGLNAQLSPVVVEESADAATVLSPGLSREVAAP